MDKYKGIGVFDSGVGGLSVASQIKKVLPSEKICYFGDTANLPYGDKSGDQIVNFVFDIIDFLMTRNLKAMVMACNTSSALVLPLLDGKTQVPTLGVIEFASRMALNISQNERIGVVANPLTVGTGAYPKAIVNISLNGTRVYQRACPQWVPLIESGHIDGPVVEDIVERDIRPLLNDGIDTLILGCTHYPFLAPVINKVSKNRIKLVDPAKALALHLREILEKSDLLSDKINPEHEFFVSGDPEDFREKGGLFFGSPIEMVTRITFDKTREKSLQRAYA